MDCILLVVILTFCSVLQQSDSAYPNGSDFYMGFLKNFDRSGQNKIEIVVSTSSSTPVAFRIHSKDQLLGSGVVPAASEVEIVIPLRYMTRSSRYSERHKGIHVTTNDSEVSIVAIASNRITSFSGSTAAYRIFQYQEAEGSVQYEYFAVSISSVAGEGLLSEFLIVGNENDTTITIYPTNETGSIVLPRDAQDGGDTTIEVRPGEGHSVVLNQLQTLLVTKTVDLTGTRIVSNKPITLLSGHECGNVPHDRPKCDHVGVHVRPTTAWGKNFLLIPFLGRPSGQYFKIVMAEDNTVIKRTCSGSLNSEMLFHSAGDSYFFRTTPFMSCYVQSNKPLLIAQLSQGGSLDGIGDPAMLLVSPIEQYVNKVSLLALNKNLFSHSYITITTSGNHFGPSNVLLDGKPVIGDWNIVISEESFIIGYGCRLQVSPGHHTVEHSMSNGRLSVIVYGFDTTLRHAYGYSGAVSSRKDQQEFMPILLPGANTPTPSPSSTPSPVSTPRPSSSPTPTPSSTATPQSSTPLILSLTTSSIMSTSLSPPTTPSLFLSESSTKMIDPSMTSAYTNTMTLDLMESDVLFHSATTLPVSSGFFNESTIPMLLAIAALSGIVAATLAVLFVVVQRKLGKSSPPSSSSNNTNESSMNNTVIDMPSEDQSAPLAERDSPQQTNDSTDDAQRQEPASLTALQRNEPPDDDQPGSENGPQRRENESQRGENESQGGENDSDNEDEDQEESDEEAESEEEEEEEEGDVDSCLAMKLALLASPPPTPLRSREPTPEEEEEAEGEEGEEEEEAEEEDEGEEEEEVDEEEEEEVDEEEEEEVDEEVKEEEQEEAKEENVAEGEDSAEEEDDEKDGKNEEEDDDKTQEVDQEGENQNEGTDERGDKASEEASRESESAETFSYPPSRSRGGGDQCTCPECQSRYHTTSSYRQYRPRQAYMYQSQYYNPYSTSRRQYNDWYSYY